MDKGRTRSIDLTQGPIARSMVLFALPLLGSSVVQQLYGTVDLLFVGNILGTGASAALGVSTMLVSCLVGFFTGISVGVNVVAARHLGTGRLDDVSRTVHTAVALSLLGGAVLAVAGWLLAPHYLTWVATPPEVAGDALLYLRVNFISMVVVVLYNMCAGLVRALGDSATPLRAQVAGGLVNVAANAVLMAVLGLGIAGAALATLFSQGLAALLLVRHLCRLDAPYRLRMRRLALHGDIVRPMLAVGVPTGLQSTVITLSNVFVQYHINQLGTVPIAAFTSYFKVELPLYYAIVSLGQAAVTFVAQNHGAGLHGRARRATSVCLALGVGLTVALAAVMLLAGRWLFWVFNQDEAVVATGVSIIWVTFPFYWLYVFLEVHGASIRGRGQALLPMAAVILNVCVLRVAFLAVVARVAPGVQSVAAAYPVTWALTSLAMFACYRMVSKVTDGPGEPCLQCP